VYDWDDNRIITNLEQLHGITTNKKIALTFDDGPSQYTESILDILSHHRVKATFFWITSQMSDKELAEKVINNGHTLGLHGYRHIPYHTLNKTIQKREMIKGLKQFEDFIGNKQKIKHFRPPYGRYNDETLTVIKELNLQPILWHIAALDWELEDDEEKIIENVSSNIQDGSIILLHDLPQTVATLDRLIFKLKSMGYDFYVI
jgi:peptidoglycan/xylan/chitin deacetylase (PgdA/CDA1 family)